MLSPFLIGAHPAFNISSGDFLDFEDGLQYFSALKANCKHIITRDLKDFKTAEISSLTPTEFLVSLQKN